MLATDIKATQSRIKQLEDRYHRELSEMVGLYQSASSNADPDAYRSAAKVTAYLTSVEIEKEKEKLIELLLARVTELEQQR